MVDRILLVEDDESLSLGLVYYFDKADYELKHSMTISEAKKSFLENEFDIVLLDIGLPDGVGFDFADFIRERSNVPIVFLTARDEEEFLLKGFEVGGDDYITKPFSLKELEARIKSILKRVKAEGPLVRKSGDLKIDIQTMRVYKGERLLDLTGSEYKLLLFFMDNYKVELSREKILEFLWDSDANFSAYSTISVYINRLREKIEDNSSEPKYIVTKRGIGYIWAMEVS